MQLFALFQYSFIRSSKSSRVTTAASKKENEKDSGLDLQTNLKQSKDLLVSFE